MRAPHRAMILGCSLLPVLVTLVIALIENVTSLWIAFTLVSLATSVTWGVTWALTREAVQTQAVAEQLHTVLGEENEDLEKLVAPISAVNHIQDKSILDVLRQLSQRIVMRRQQLKENAVNLVNTMMIAADTTKMLPVHYEYAAPEEKYRKAVSSGYQQLVKSIQITRQRLEAFSSFLREMPAALIVTDNQHRIITANPAAEKLFGQSSKQLQKTRLAQLLNDSVVAVDPADPESPRPLTPFNALNQLKKTKGEELLVQKKGSTPTFLKVQQQSNSNYSLVVFRSVGEELSTLSKNTVERRKATIQNMAAYVESQLAPSLSQAHADLRVMAGVVKRLPQKDQILPSLTQCQQNLGRLSITHSLLDWLVRIETNQLRLSVPEEVKLSEITEKVRNQFAIWLKERGIKLEVADEGSWMLCDETCVEVLLSSALTHAVAACKGDSIHLTLGRSKVRSEDKVELRYEFEAEAPSEEFLADLAQPYRRQNTSFLDHQQKGSVLGLYVAQQLARLLDGEAHLEVADKNQCTLVVRVPTRPPVALQEDSSQEQEVLATVGQFGLGSETVADELVESEEAYSEVHEEELVESAALSRASTIDINTDDAEFVSDTLGDWKLG